MRRALQKFSICVALLALTISPASQAAVNCGAAGQACCANNACNSGLTCQYGACVTGVTNNGAVIELSNPISGGGTLDSVAAKVLDLLVQLGAPLAGVMVVVGGFQILFAGGSEEKFASGKRTILYTVVGYGIIVLADGVAAFITNLLQ
jgi:hypothetical protein